MFEPIIHAASRRQLESFINNPSHALIIFGPEGSGKGTVASWLAARLLGLEDEAEFDKYPHLKIVQPDGQSISIDAIRELLQFTKLKIAAAGDSIKRIVVVEQSHMLTVEAQNALLKLLEEPPADTLLILTAAHDTALLPTIRSRAQSIHLQMPTKTDLSEYFATKDYPATAVQQSYLMSGGLPGLMSALLDDTDQHPLAQAARQARELLQASTFDRLARVDGLSKQRADCTRVLFMLTQMAHAALEQSAAKTASPDKRNLARWHHILQASYDAQTALQASAQPKLVLTNLMLGL